MAKRVIKGEEQNFVKRTRVLILRKTKTLNNFNKNQNQIQYFVIILAIIKTSKANVCCKSACHLKY